MGTWGNLGETIGGYMEKWRSGEQKRQYLWRWKKSYGGPIGTHQRSFERYYPRPPMASPSSRLGVRNLATLLISGTVSYTDFKFCRNSHRVDRNKSPWKTLGIVAVGRSQSVPKIFRSPMRRAYCAVIFAIAQLSCTSDDCDPALQAAERRLLQLQMLSSVTCYYCSRCCHLRPANILLMF